MIIYNRIPIAGLMFNPVVSLPGTYLHDQCRVHTGDDLMPVGHYPIRLLLIMTSVLLVFGCASSFQPRPMDEVNLLERAQTISKGKLRVTAIVLSAAEFEAKFGVNLYRRNI